MAEDNGQYALLRVLSGPLAGQAYTLDRASIIIGREKGCNIRPDQYAEVSRRHARLLWDQGFCIEDLGSRNRTTVAGEPVMGIRRLRNGDVITLGDFSAQLVLPSQGALIPPAQTGSGQAGSNQAGSNQADSNAATPRAGKLPVPAMAAAVMGVVALGIFGSLNGSGTAKSAAGSPAAQQAPGAASEGENPPSDGKKTAEDKPQGQTPAPANGTELSETDLEHAKDSTILIMAKNPDREEYSQGSGFCAFNPKIVVTNAHVVLTAEAQPRPSLLALVLRSGQKGQKVVRGEVIAIDAKDDLALVEIKGDSDLSPMQTGDPTALKETEVCFAFGFPGVRQLRHGAPEVSVQRVSVEALRRDDSGELSRIQLGGTITHGNSGGPIVDNQGRVVGVVREAARTPEGVRQDPQQAAGISYAIPVTRLEAMLKELKTRSEQNSGGDSSH